jgi:membrane protein implicated in regulation of membrane protease activity
MGKGSGFASLILQALLTAMFFSLLWTFYGTKEFYQTFFISVTAMVSAYFVRKLLEALLRRQK